MISQRSFNYVISQIKAHFTLKHGYHKCNRHNEIKHDPNNVVEYQVRCNFTIPRQVTLSFDQFYVVEGSLLHPAILWSIMGKYDWREFAVSSNTVVSDGKV